jgi:hypothetical protein
MRVNELKIERNSLKHMQRYFMASAFHIKTHFFSHDFILQLLGEFLD